MKIWLLIGTVFGAAVLLAIWRGRSRVAVTGDDHGVDPSESRRQADVVAGDAARMADAKIPPLRGGRPF